MTENKEKKLANPTKFGMAGVGIALLMLGFHFITVITFNTVIFATILTMGVIAPLLAGITEYISGNSFRSTSFILFGLFFLTLYIFSTRVLGVAADVNSQGIFYLAWTLIIAVILCGTIIKKMGAKMIMLQIVLATFLIFTLLLALAQFFQVKALFIVAGVFALICAVVIFVDFVMHICIRMKKDAE